MKAKIKSEYFFSVCSYCEKVKGANEKWYAKEKIARMDMEEKTPSHGICPSCYKKKVIPELKALRERKRRE